MADKSPHKRISTIAPITQIPTDFPTVISMSVTLTETVTGLDGTEANAIGASDYI